MNIIAIDCGASFLKGALFQNNVIVKRAQRQSPAVHGVEGLLKPVQINLLIPMVKGLILELASDVDEFTLCLSNEMHGFILANQDGSPYTDYISWQKEFGNEEIDGQSSVDILKQEYFAEDILKSGMPLRGGLPSSNMLYLKRTGIISDKSLFFYTLGDYIVRLLSGKEPLCHPTNAAATGLYDLLTGQWNSHLKETVSVINISFPQIGIKPIDIIFEGHQVTCFPAIGDQQAALLGAGFENEVDLSFNLGTGAQVSRLTKSIDLSNNYQIRPYFKGYYLKSIPHLPSGRALNVFIRFFKDVLQVFGVVKNDADIWNCLLNEEKKCGHSDLKVDLSFFQTPLTDHEVGCIDNIGEHELYVGKLMKAIVNQMVYNFIDIAERLEPDKTKIKRLLFSGGVARRIGSLREGIISHYCNDIPVVVSEDETLVGLNKYAVNEA